MMASRATIKEWLGISVEKYANRPSFAFVGETPITYEEFGVKVNQLSVYLQGRNIQKGDRIGIYSTNMPNWMVSYFSIANIGAVAVPMLPDFHQEEIRNIIKHSGLQTMFVSENLYYKIKDLEELKDVDLLLIDRFCEIPKGAEKGDLKKLSTIDFADNELAEVDVDEDDLVSIIYTSGTTGKSKGVMLTHKNFITNAFSAKKIQSIDEQDRFLSFLPLSHALEFTVCTLIAFLSGSSVFFLTKPPTPNVLLPALKQVKPTVMLTVPLIMEKIYKGKVLPQFNANPVLKFLYHHTPVRKLLNRAAGKKLMETFGGCLKFYGIGGAKLDGTVEKFLREAKFPYAIGYGLTETAPLLAGANPQHTKLYSTGPAIEGVEMKILNPDPKTGEGEVVVKGPNVMKGYYKQPDLTKEVFTEDGWFRTGDLGAFDKDGFLFIRGRLKNMILGASGENIYPEEIETVINNFRYVLESIVVERKGKLVALVHLNMEELEARVEQLKIDLHRMEEIVDDHLVELQQYVNSRVNKFSQVQLVVAQSNPFEKTATHKIKRFLYE